MAEAADAHVVTAISRNKVDHLVDHRFVVVCIVTCEGHDLCKSKHSVLVQITLSEINYTFFSIPYSSRDLTSFCAR